MVLLRILIIGAAILLAVYFLRRLLRGDKTSTPRGNASSKNMVRCALCGIHIPQTEALVHKDEFFCSRQHLEQKQNS